MSGNARVLTGLMERRALEAALNELARISNPALQVARAQEIADQGAAVLPVLVSMLDTEDPQLRGGLGQVAVRLKHEEVVFALRQVARSQEQSEHARLSALTILERFLGEPVDEALLVGLQNPEGIAQQSLREALHEMAHNPFAVIEYLDQLAEQPPEAAQMILDAIPSMPASPHLVTILRMFAQGQDESLARTALEQLGRMRTDDAALALLSLTATLPPHQAMMAERGLRKLRLSGVQTASPNTSLGRSSWRAMLSPISGAGHQVIWFIRKADGKTRGTLFSILARDPEGITASFGSTELPADALPPAQPVGRVHKVAQSPDLPPITFLEVPFDAGRQVVREALEINWQSGNPTPLEYRLLNPLIWGTEFEPDPNLLPAPKAADCSPTEATKLLDHPAFAGWFWQDPALADISRVLGREPDPETRRAHITVLANAKFTPEMIASYRRRLTGMARWLTLASQREAAGLAQAAAKHLTLSAPADTPFIRRLIEIGLDVAIVSLRIKNLV